MRKGETLNAEGEHLASELTELEALCAVLKAFRRQGLGGGEGSLLLRLISLPVAFVLTVSEPCSLFLRPGSLLGPSEFFHEPVTVAELEGHNHVDDHREGGRRKNQGLLGRMLLPELEWRVTALAC